MLQQKGTTSKMVLVLLFAVYALLSAGGLVLFKLGGQDAAVQVGENGLFPGPFLEDAAGDPLLLVQAFCCGW